MSKGKGKRVLLGIQGLIGHKTAPDYGFIYKTSLVMDPKWYPGDSLVLPDGSEYRYAKSYGVCSAAEACQFDHVGVIAYIAATAVAIGATELTVPAQTHLAAIEVDELRGGYVNIFANDTDNATQMFRRIIGNDYSAISAAVKIYLDGPTDIVMDTGSAIEVFENPWMRISASGLGGLAADGDVDRGKAGVAAVYVGAADTYFWIQVTGPRFVNPQSNVIDNMLGVYFRHDGSIEAEIPSKDANNNTTQYAGHIMMGNHTGNGPIIWLAG